MNLKTVAHTATNALIGTASAMPMLKKISMIGMLLPAPERPPALDRVIRIIIRNVPIMCCVVKRFIFPVFALDAGGAWPFLSVVESEPDLESVVAISVTGSGCSIMISAGVLKKSSS